MMSGAGPLPRIRRCLAGWWLALARLWRDRFRSGSFAETRPEDPAMPAGDWWRRPRRGRRRVAPGELLDWIGLELRAALVRRVLQAPGRWTPETLEIEWLADGGGTEEDVYLRQELVSHGALEVVSVVIEQALFAGALRLEDGRLFPDDGAGGAAGRIAWTPHLPPDDSLSARLPLPESREEGS